MYHVVKVKNKINKSIVQSVNKNPLLNIVLFYNKIVVRGGRKNIFMENDLKNGGKEG